MRKRILLLALVLVFTLTASAYALEIPGYDGGIKNEMRYKEVVFITGEPIIVEGTVNISNSGSRLVLNYRNLVNLEKNVTLSRNVTYDKTINTNGNDQKTETYSLSRFRETITVEGVKYESTEQTNQWSKSTIFHQKPGVEYFKGSWDGRRVYTINKDQGTVEVITVGDTYGYDHTWGSTETQRIQHYINYSRILPGENGTQNRVTWQGTAEVHAAHNRTKEYSYEPNVPTQSSFKGAYMLVEQQENVLKYSYDLPRFDDAGEIISQRNTGVNSLSLNTNPKNEMLFIPAMRDIGGHTSERDILFLASLGAINPNSQNFGPTLSMSRGDFARAMVVIMDLMVEEQTNVRQRTVVLEEKPKIFNDIASGDSNAKYIEAAFKKGIMQGVGDNQFYPNQYLTKAQAVTVLVKTLGFEHLAPIQRYATGYRDDHQIPNWAKDSIYVARELGILRDSHDGYFQPNKWLTKAEAAVMLADFIDYLQHELRYDYRERILNYAY